MANSDFEKSTQAMQRALDSSSADPLLKTIRLVDLANCYLEGYTITSSASLLDTATQLLQEAADATELLSPKHNPDHNAVFSALGNCYRRKYDLTRLKPDIEAAISFLSLAFEWRLLDTTGDIVRSLLIAQSLASALILVQDWHKAYSVVDNSIPMISMTIPRFLDVSESQACLSKYTCLASDGAAIAVSHGRQPIDAIRILEDGRAVAMMALNELRINVESIWFMSKDQKKEFLDICKQVEAFQPKAADCEAADRTDSSNSSLSRSSNSLLQGEAADRSATRGVARRVLASRKFTDLIYKYQARYKQTAFFGEVDTGMAGHAVSNGWIVIINVSYRCDAFLIKGYTSRVLPLPKLSREAIQERVREDNLTSLQVLGWLWDTIASPVLDALGYTSPPLDNDQWPRIWWIPTGSLTMFPLHAAGRHTKWSQDNVIDRVMSSYSPSVRALYENSRLRASMSMLDKAQPQGHVRALLVAMEHTAGSTPLPFAAKEVAAVSEVCKRMAIEPFQPDQCTTATVQSHLRNCDIFHFAGHGYTDPNDPSRSHLRLQDWMSDPLTVADMVAINVREKLPFLAYLSACGTGRIEDAKHLDESIHLISACQLAGFRHVVGTLCKVNDEICVDMAKITYEAIRTGGMTDESVCRGLHNAVRTLRDRWRDGPAATTRLGKRRRGIKEDGDGRCLRDGVVVQRDDRLLRDASLSEDDDDKDEETRFLQWAPYVHYGC